MQGAGKEAWFVPEEPLTFGQEGEDAPHTILTNQQQICALCLFSWIQAQFDVAGHE